MQSSGTAAIMETQSASGAVAADGTQGIPKIVHYVWVGTRALPDEDRRRVDAWQKIMPDWEFRRWGNDDVDFSSPFIRGAFSVRAWNRVSDYTRMDALARIGGVYLDTDVDIVRPFDPLLSNRAFLGFQTGDENPSEMVNGAVFGSVAGHWLPTAIRDHFNTKVKGHLDIGSFAGPGLLTHMLREKGLQSYRDEPFTVADVTLYPRRYFYPYWWADEFHPDCIVEDTFAVHRWAETWVAKPGLKARWKRKFFNRFGRHMPELALYVTRAVARRAAS
ncbi:hypothetical protein FY036_17845 [Mesorhizobium microcysteis]|uniref:Glycosyl transferase n=1 Tax=Neoaquamicrobium microcysteis TaxID=2682781 RepID=A0A5D4GP16_9HYPH|nr:glycosyltransferase [Mesorhizobium microcysteis]TYR30576.1 hypothetical protein FY036_17845 [Mesorhizobium microcysteis]